MIPGQRLRKFIAVIWICANRDHCKVMEAVHVQQISQNLL